LSETPDPGTGSPEDHGSQLADSPRVPDEDRSFAADMGRLFLIPAVIVALTVAVYFLFGMIASERRTAEDYLQEVRHGSTKRKWQAAFELSRLLTRDEAARSDTRLAREIADILADPATNEPLIKRYLLLALEEIGEPGTAPVAIAALEDQDPEVRLYAARALGRLGDAAAVAGLMALLEEEDPALRKMALFSLGRIGDAGAIGGILPRLEDPVEDVRWNAALALAVLGDSSGGIILRQMLDASYLDGVNGITEVQKIEARVNAIQAAYRLRDPSLRVVVEVLSREDPSLRVRDAALRILKEWDGS
jgi:HEAT repeat protein